MSGGGRGVWARAVPGCSPQTFPGSPTETEVCVCCVPQGRACARGLLGTPCQQPVLIASGEPALGGWDNFPWKVCPRKEVPCPLGTHQGAAWPPQLLALVRGPLSHNP